MQEHQNDLKNEMYLAGYENSEFQWTHQEEGKNILDDDSVTNQIDTQSKHEKSLSINTTDKESWITLDIRM